MKIILTGASGMVGSRLLGVLQDRDNEVFPVGRDNSTQPGLVVMDLRHPDEVNTLPADADCIIHLAAMLPAPGTDHDPQEWFDHNAFSTLNLLKFCSTNRIPSFIYASSWSVYGDPTSRGKVNERDELLPDDLYGISKLAGEYFCDSFEYFYKIKLSKLRFSYIYGSGMRKDTVVMRFLKAAKHGDDVSLFNGGSDVTDLLFVDDAVSAILAAIERPCGICNIGGGVPVTIRELADLIIYISGNKSPLSQAVVNTKPRAMYLDIKRARQRLSWFPRYDLMSGLAELMPDIR